MKFPPQLRPTTHDQIRLPSGRTIEVPKTTPQFHPWPVHRAPMVETFGGKPVLSFGGRPMFAELVILNMFLDAGWRGRWVETYAARSSGPYFYMDWADRPQREQVHVELESGRDWSILEEIRRLRGGHSGFWDVMVWRDDRLVFVEGKRTKKDRLQKTQLAWLEAALEAGLTSEQFLIVEWSCAD